MSWEDVGSALGPINERMSQNISGYWDKKNRIDTIRTQ